MKLIIILFIFSNILFAQNTTPIIKQLNALEASAVDAKNEKEAIEIINNKLSELFQKNEYFRTQKTYYKNGNIKKRMDCIQHIRGESIKKSCEAKLVKEYYDSELAKISRISLYLYNIVILDVIYKMDAENYKIDSNFRCLSKIKDIDNIENKLLSL